MISYRIYYILKSIEKAIDIYSAFGQLFDLRIDWDKICVGFDIF